MLLVAIVAMMAIAMVMAMVRMGGVHDGDENGDGARKVAMATMIVMAMATMMVITPVTLSVILMIADIIATNGADYSLVVSIFTLGAEARSVTHVTLLLERRPVPLLKRSPQLQ